MTTDLNRLIEKFLSRQIVAVEFCEQYMLVYQNHRDINMENFSEDWTEGGYFSTVFVIADLFKESPPRYTGELNAEQLYDVVNEEYSRKNKVS